MKKFAENIVSKAMEANQLATTMVNNAADWLYKNDELILADRTPYDVVYETDLVKLRRYQPLEESFLQLSDGSERTVNPGTYRVPLVIVPPLAVNMLIYDLFPDQSYVKYMRAAGFDVFLIDWGSPGRKHAHYDMGTYVNELMPEMINKVCEITGEDEVSLQGWSMGGQFCLLYTGVTEDNHVKNVITVASPINTHASGPQGKMWNMVLNGPAAMIRKYTSFRVHKLNPKWMAVPGWANSLGFKMTDPVGTIRGYWELVLNLADREFVQNHLTRSAFLDGMVAYPGGIMQDTTIKVWLDNDFHDGKVEIGGKESNFNAIKASLLGFGGSSDVMVTATAARGVMDAVDSPDKQFVIAPGGHMGVFVSRKAIAENWAVTADWLADRSK